MTRVHGSTCRKTSPISLVGNRSLAGSTRVDHDYFVSQSFILWFTPNNRNNRLLNLEVEDVHDHVGFAIQQNAVSRNQHLRAFRRGRWYPPPQLFCPLLHPLLAPP